MVGGADRFFDGLIKQINGDDRLALGNIQIKGDLLFRRKRMHHIGDRSDTVQRVEAVQTLRDIRHTEGDPVAFSDPQTEERPRTAFDPGDEFRIAGLFAVELIRRLLRQLLRDFFDHLIHGQLGIFQMLPLYIFLAHFDSDPYHTVSGLSL